MQTSNSAFCRRNRLKTLEILKKVYGNNVIKKAVYEWHKCFLERHTNIEDDFKLGILPLPPQMKMLKVFFDYEDIIHYEFKAALTVNKEL